MRKSVVIILADGFEEIEAVTPIDVLAPLGILEGKKCVPFCYRTNLMMARIDINRRRSA